MVGFISLKELQKFLQEKKGYVLIDVRDKEELSYGMIPTEKHLSVYELQEALQLNPEKFKAKYNFPKLGKQELIIFYCRTGHRSGMATAIATQAGYTAKTYSGGVWEYSQIDPKVKRY